MSLENEYVTIEMEHFKWQCLRNEFHLVNNVDFKLKDVKIKDDYFKDDETHSILKKAAVKAYKQLNEYEFNKRNNIKK